MAKQTNQISNANRSQHSPVVNSSSCSLLAVESAWICPTPIPRWPYVQVRDWRCSLFRFPNLL